jgi:bifunctional non-homologous end joining protein LigD
MPGSRGAIHSSEALSGKFPMAISSRNRIPFRVQPMLASLVEKPFHRDGWVYEEKYDGDRMLAYKEGDQVQLLSRNAIDRTDRFPKIAAAILHLRPATLLLDGEIVAFDERGVSRFQLLQRGEGNLVFAAFDCLYQNGKDFRREPLSVRRAALEKLLPSSERLRLSRRLASNGLEAFDEAKRLGYEGLVAKNISSPYYEGRSNSWLKVKVHQEDEFVIVGYTKPSGARDFFGVLLLGVYEGAALRYVGKVGTGFDQKTLAWLHGKFKPRAKKDPVLANPPREKHVTFVSPQLVAQISFHEWTSDQKLRQPVFLGLRDDKRPRDVRMPKAGA